MSEKTYYFQVEEYKGRLQARQLDGRSHAYGIDRKSRIPLNEGEIFRGELKMITPRNGNNPFMVVVPTETFPLPSTDFNIIRVEGRTLTFVREAYEYQIENHGRRKYPDYVLTSFTGVVKREIDVDLFTHQLSKDVDSWVHNGYHVYEIDPTTLTNYAEWADQIATAKEEFQKANALPLAHRIYPKEYNEEGMNVVIYGIDKVSEKEITIKHMIPWANLRVVNVSPRVGYSPEIQFEIDGVEDLLKDVCRIDGDIKVSTWSLKDQGDSPLWTIQKEEWFRTSETQYWSIGPKGTCYEAGLVRTVNVPGFEPAEYFTPEGSKQRRYNQEDIEKITEDLFSDFFGHKKAAATFVGDTPSGIAEQLREDMNYKPS